MAYLTRRPLFHTPTPVRYVKCTQPVSHRQALHPIRHHSTTSHQAINDLLSVLNKKHCQCNTGALRHPALPAVCPISKPWVAVQGGGATVCMLQGYRSWLCAHKPPCKMPHMYTRRDSLTVGGVCIRAIRLRCHDRRLPGDGTATG